MPPPEDLTQDRLLASLPRDKKGRPVLGAVSLIRKIGVGGMGTVYLGRQDELQRDVAVKVLPFTLVEADPSLARRFSAEARLAASLESDHVVRVFGAGHEHRTHFYVMQYVAGESAGGYLKRRKAEGKGPIPEDEVLRIGIAAARGLAAAHEKGIVHRDVKPDNILIPKGDLDGAKIADLGLAKPEGSVQTFGTLSHVAMGTPGFMAPEQAEDAKTAGPAADVFAMGASLYAMLTGGPPFRGTSLVAVIRAALEEEAPPLPDSVSPGLQWAIERCLLKNPKERFRDGAELVAALERVKKNPNATMAKPRKIELGSGSKSRAPMWAGIAVVALVVAIGAGVMLKKKKAAPPPGTAAEEKEDEGEALFQQAQRLENEGRLEDALASLSRAAAFAPDDARVAEWRARIEGKIEARKSTSTHAELWKIYEAGATAARNAADTADTVGVWDKALEAYATLKAEAKSDEEHAQADRLLLEGRQRRGWAAARFEDSQGNTAKAIDLARKALGEGPKNEFLEAYIVALEKKSKEMGEREAKKKLFDEAVARAEAETDAKKARVLWEAAIGATDDPVEKARAEERLREVTAKLEGSARDELYEAAIREAEAALKAGDLDLAARRLQDALNLKESDGRARELIAQIDEKRTQKSWDDALREIDVVKKGSDTAALKAAYRKALAIRNDPTIAKALADLEAEATAIRPVINGNRMDVVIDPAKGITLTFVKVKPGTFMMGPPADQRRVQLTKEFWLMTTEVTQDMWNALMPAAPSLNHGGNLPIECVTWYDAMEFAARINDRLVGYTVSLPSSAQWEYAARAGSKSEFGPADSLDDLGEYAWMHLNGGKVTHPVGTKKPNAWGFYDMQGNVWEYVWDWHAPLPAGKELVDPTGPPVGSDKSSRGGGSDHPGDSCQPALCGPAKVDGVHGDLGFRLMLAAGEEGNPHLRHMTVTLDETKKIRMEFVLVRAGTYTQGGVSPEGKARQVTIREDFWMAKTETTQAQFEALLGKHAFSRRGADLPADNIKWEDAQNFLRRLGQRTRLKPTLPTEAEWEYACRAATTTRFSNGDNTSTIHAWHNGNAKESQPAGRLRANVWDLHDMHGNVREWCLDWYAPWGSEAATDPRGPAAGSERVVRGGAFDEAPENLASGARDHLAPDKKLPNVGFRAVLRP